MKKISQFSNDIPGAMKASIILHGYVVVMKKFLINFPLFFNNCHSSERQPWRLSKKKVQNFFKAVPKVVLIKDFFHFFFFFFFFCTFKKKVGWGWSMVFFSHGKGLIIYAGQKQQTALNGLKYKDWVCIGQKPAAEALHDL